MIDVGLPRAVASRVSVQSLAFTQRVIAVAGSLLGTSLVVDVQLGKGVTDGLPLMLTPMIGIGMLALALIWKPTVVMALVYLLGGAVLSISLPVIGLAVDPSFDESGAYLLNRVATALCLVGAVGTSALSGMLWTAVAFVVAHSSVVVGLAVAGSTSPPGVGPLLVFAISFVAYLTLAVSQRESARRLRPIHEAQHDVVNLDDRRALERRAASVLHDTLLADLTAIAQHQGAVTDRMRTVLAEHARLVDSATVAADSDEALGSGALGESLRGLAREYQWSGVRVDVSGVDTVDHSVDAEVRHALLSAVRAALDNVVKHASTDRAEIVVGVREAQLTVLVVDDGVGFAASEVLPDRLGVRASIVDRIEQVGGSVRVWSGPDGTTIMMTVPIVAGAV